MACVTELPVTSFQQLSERFAGVVMRIGNDFSTAISSGKSSTIAERMRRSSETVTAIARCSNDCTLLTMAGAPGSYDIASLLIIDMRARLRAYFNDVNPVGTKFDGTRLSFPNITAVDLAAVDLRRIAAEASVSYHNLEVQPHIAPMGGSIREEVTRIASKSGKWAQILDAIADAAFAAMDLVRATEEYRQGLDHPLYAKINSAIDMASRLTLPEERAAMLESKFMSRHLEAQKHTFGCSFGVARILELGNTKFRSELLLTDATLKRFIPAATDKTKSCVQKVLISNNAKLIAEDRTHGVLAALVEPMTKRDQFETLVVLLDFDPHAVVCIEGAVQTATEEAAAALVGKHNPSDFARCVPHLLRLAAAYNATVSVERTSPANALSFNVAAHRGILAAMPPDGSFEEALASLVDAILKEKKSTPDTRPARLADLLHGAQFVRDPALFGAFYKRYLAARLLLRPYVSLTLETTTLDAIASRLGAQSVRLLREMVKDASALRGAAAGNASESNALCSATGSSYVWPHAPATLSRLRLPNDIANRCAQAVDQRHAAWKKRRGVQLQVDPLLTAVELKVRSRGGDGPSCTVLCCAAQASLLNAVIARGGAGVSLGELAEQLNIDDAAVGIIAHSIVTGSTLMTWTDESTFSAVRYDTDFLSGLAGDKKISLPSLFAFKRRGTSAAAAEDKAAAEIAPESDDDDTSLAAPVDAPAAATGPAAAAPAVPRLWRTAVGNVKNLFKFSH